MRARHGVGHGVDPELGRFRSASCLPIRQVVNAQLCTRSTSSHLRRTPTCGYVDNASALPTDPQDQKTKVSVNLIALEAQHSNPVRHNHDRQPRHPSPHSASMLATIHKMYSCALVHL